MKLEIVAVIIVVRNFIRWGWRFVGWLLLGLMGGWLTMRTFTQAPKSWQVQAAATAVILFIASAMVNSPNPAAVGAYTLGAAAGIFIWGFNKDKG